MASPLLNTPAASGTFGSVRNAAVTIEAYERTGADTPSAKEGP